MKDSIIEELLRYEFYRFSTEEDTISAEDFGKSMVAYMPTSLIDMYLERLEQLKLEGRVTLNQYLAFMFVMQEATLIYQKLSLEHIEHGTILKSNITKVLTEICLSSNICQRKGLEISDLQVEIFINVLDLDDSGSLEPEEIINLVASRGSQGTGQTVSPNFEEVVNEFKKFINALLKFSGHTPIFKVKTEEKRTA